jgi:glycerol kinase
VSVIVAIDAGTTGVRSLAVSAAGAVVASRYREFTQHFPRPGWVEHDAEEIWEAVQATLRDLAETLTEPIAAIGITNQRETIVAWSRSSGRPLHRAIVWQDRRTADRCEELADHLPRVRRLTGLVLDPYFSGSKLEWLFRHGGVERTADLAVGTVDSWLIWKLTGGRAHVTDPSNASRTMLYDIVERHWSDELCDLFGVPMGALPEVRPSCGRFGTTTTGCAAGAGIAVSGLAGDQQSALFGQACFDVGMTKNTYGTGSFVLMNVGEDCPPPSEGLLTTIGWTVPASVFGDTAGNPSARGGDVTHYALEGAIFVTGATVQWLRDGLEIIDDAAETGPLAESVEDSAGAVMVPAFTGLGSPWWDPHARGTIVGLTRGVTRAHLARAAVEAMAFQTRDVVESMSTASGRTVAELRVDGGAAVMPLLLQLQADQLGVPVTRPASTETTALGAAYLAGLAEGVWSTVAEVQDAWVVDARVEPSADRASADAAYGQWLRAVERSRSWA